MPITGSWSDPNTLDLLTNQVLSQTAWENLVGNFLYLGGSGGQGMTVAFKASGTTANPQTASTSYVVLPEMSVTLTALSNSFAFIFAEYSLTNSGGNSYLSFRVNSSSFGSWGGERQVGGSASVQRLIYWSYIDGLTAGTQYTIDAGWRVSSGTVTATSTERSIYVYQWRH